jgi:uncharacterized protein YkwD
MKCNYLILCILSLFFLIGCQKDDVVVVNVNKQVLVDLINDVRSKGCNCGTDSFPPVNPIKWNDTLAMAALEHSNDMNNNAFFDHKGSDNSSPADRITKTGYIWRNIGENIAMGYTSEEEVVKGWINSPGHCKNIMTGNFKDMGVAMSGNYWTQDFASH